MEKDGALRAFTNNFFPTKIKIEQFLDNISQYIKPEDLIVFSFSGHGVNDANVNGYLLPLDCRLSSLYATAVSEATITTWLKKLGVTRSLVMLDACRSELRSDRSITGRDVLYSPKFESAKVSAVFYSSEKGAASYEDPNSPNGAFTRFVAAGLQGAGDRDNDGLVTFRELQTHVENAMMEWALGTGHSQRPYIRLLDEQSGDLALAITDWSKIKRQYQPPIPLRPSEADLPPLSVASRKMSHPYQQAFKVLGLCDLIFSGGFAVAIAVSGGSARDALAYGTVIGTAVTVILTPIIFLNAYYDSKTARTSLGYDRYESHACRVRLAPCVVRIGEQRWGIWLSVSL